MDGDICYVVLILFNNALCSISYGGDLLITGPGLVWSGLSNDAYLPPGHPSDPGSYEAFKDDPVCKALLEDKNIMSQLDDTKSPSQVNASEFKVIFYAGGHGPMFDLPQCDAIGKLGAQIYQSGGIVSAVCHGTVGLIPIQLDNGDSILKGQTVTSFTNAEEEAVKLMEAMPFPLETRLKELGAKFVGVENFVPNVEVSGRIVTGQNPASATPTAESVLKLLR